jgi:hypothetical protein
MSENNKDWMVPSLEFLRKIFPSEEMASYLAECRIKNIDMIAKMVVLAPFSLERKRELLLSLEEDGYVSWFTDIADEIAQILQDMQLKPMEILMLKHCGCDESGQQYEDKYATAPFFSWEHLWKRVKELMAEDAENEDDMTWFIVERWTPDEAGQLTETCDYEILDGEICHYLAGDNERDKYENYHEVIQSQVNLPVPFHAGDIVTIDCRPFAPVIHAVILTVGDNVDCCCLQSACRSKEGKWESGGVKHGYCFPNEFDYQLLDGVTSPLYRLSTYKGELSEDEKFLGLVSQYVNGDEDRGESLFWVHTDEDVLKKIGQGGDGSQQFKKIDMEKKES